jgi:hypothetical protein
MTTEPVRRNNENPLKITEDGPFLGIFVESNALLSDTQHDARFQQMLICRHAPLQVALPPAFRRATFLLSTNKVHQTSKAELLNTGES